MHYEWNTFASNWNHGGISCDVHFAGHLRSDRTNVWSDKSNIRNVQSGGARGLELRTAGLYWGVLQLQQRLLLLYLWETTDAWSLRQLQLASSETAFSFPRWLVGLVTLYISDERWAEIALRDWEIASLSQSVELRQAASSQIVHLNIK